MGTYTANYNLFLPTIGEQGWGELVNGNFTTIDATMSGLNTRMGTAETNITSLTTRMGTAETTITSNKSRIGTLETETAAVEARVTTLEAGEFESVIVGNISATTGNLENLTSVKTSSLTVDYIASSTSVSNCITVTVAGTSTGNTDTTLTSGTLGGYDVPEFVGLIKLGECKNTFTVPVSISGYAKATSSSGNYNIYADGVLVGTLTFYANPNSSYTSVSTTVNIPIPTKTITYSFASGNRHKASISAGKATFYLTPYTP